MSNLIKTAFTRAIPAFLKEVVIKKLPRKVWVRCQMTELTYTPSEFQEEFEERRQRLAQSQDDRDAIRKMAEQVNDATASLASDEIIDLVMSGRRPNQDLLLAWCRGGAVFWLDDHVTLGEGWPIADFFGEDDLPLRNPASAVTMLRENWDEWYRAFGKLFGKIPIRASDGREAVLISVCGFGTTDMPLCVVRSEEVFLRMVKLTGTLWGPDFADGDPMRASDGVLMQHITRAERFVRS